MRDESEGADRYGVSELGREPQTEQTIVIEDEALRRGFTQLPNYLFQVRGLSHSAKLTYALILSYAWQKDYCFPGQETLARDLEVSTRSVIEYLKELQTHKLIRIQRRGLGLTNVYHVLRYPPSPQASPPPSHQEVKSASYQEVKRRTPPKVQPSSAPESQGFADQEVQSSSHKKDAPSKQTTHEQTKRQQKRAAARAKETMNVSQDGLQVTAPAATGALSGEGRMARAALQAYGIEGEHILSDLTADPSEALRQIERLRQELERGVVVNPAGWLVEAIRGRYRVAPADLASYDAHNTEPAQDSEPARLAAPLANGEGRDDDPMTASTPEEMAWTMVRAELRAELTPENYRRWFVPTMAVALRDDRLIVGVPDAFHLQWLDRRLRGSIERAARRVLGEIAIEFVLAGRASA